MGPRNISLGIISPYIPEYMISFPYFSNPCFSREDRISSSGSSSSRNEVASKTPPSIAATFAPSVSRSCPMVIRDGIACGLIIISGVIPDAVRGISTSSINIPMVPFCPWRFDTLSPRTGDRYSVTRTFTSLSPSEFSDMNTRSTIPDSSLLGVKLESLSCVLFLFAFIVRETSTILSWTLVPDLTIPFSSRPE